MWQAKAVIRLHRYADEFKLLLSTLHEMNACYGVCSIMLMQTRVLLINIYPVCSA